MPIHPRRATVAIVALVSGAVANEARPRSLYQDEAARAPLRSLAGVLYGMSDASGFQYHGAKLGAQGARKVSTVGSSRGRSSNRILMEEEVEEKTQAEEEPQAEEKKEYKKNPMDYRDRLEAEAARTRSNSRAVVAATGDAEDFATKVASFQTFLDRASRTKLKDLINGKGSLDDRLAPAGSIRKEELAGLERGMPARMCFFKGVADSNVPEVSMAKNMQGGGAAILEFETTDFLQPDWNPEGEEYLNPDGITELIVYDYNGKAGSTNELTALYDDDENVIGVKAYFELKKPHIFNRFMNFMEEYSQERGLAYEAPEKTIWEQNIERQDARKDEGENNSPIEI